MKNVAFAFLGAMLVAATSSSAAVTYTYSSTRTMGGPDVSFQYTSENFINTKVELSYAELAPTGTTKFDYVNFCPAGSSCGHGSYMFIATGDEIYLINLQEPDVSPPPPPEPITLPDGTVIYPTPVTSVSQDAIYAAGTFDSLGTFTATTNRATLKISDGSSAPEPASWAMMIGGFGLMGAALRRKKANVSFA